jgi:hypothetical protein
LAKLHLQPSPLSRTRQNNRPCVRGGSSFRSAPPFSSWRLVGQRNRDAAASGFKPVAPAASGGWKYSSSFNIADIPLAIRVLQLAQQHIEAAEAEIAID